MMSDTTSSGERKLLYFDDLQVGRRFVSRTHLVDEAQIVEFARQFDPQPFHLDAEAAKQTFFQGLAASGWHTAAITMRLLVESAPIAGGVIGAGAEINWPKPVPPGRNLARRERSYRNAPAAHPPGPRHGHDAERNDQSNA